jgi:hypothetical protein
MTITHTVTYRGFTLVKTAADHNNETLFWTVSTPTTIPELNQQWTTEEILKQRIDLYLEA